MSSDDRTLLAAMRIHFYAKFTECMDEFTEAFAGENFIISVRDWLGKEHTFLVRWSLIDFKHELLYGNSVPEGYTGTEPKVEYKINKARRLELVNFTENSGVDQG